MAKRNVLKEKSYLFAIRIVNLTRFLQGEKSEYNISKQIIRCGTSIGENIEEASGAQSDKDFIAKMHISLKEARETALLVKIAERHRLFNSRTSREYVERHGRDNHSSYPES